MEKVNKKDFIEILYTGRVNGEVFDSNIEEDLKSLNSQLKPKKMVVVVGEKMVVSGLDADLEGKEIGKKYHLNLKPKEAFGERDRNLVKIIPLKIFTQQRVNPQAGATLLLDNMLVKILTVSGGRVITDFNGPLAGKDVTYEYSIKSKVHDNHEKAKALFEFFFRFVPEFTITGNNITVKGKKQIELFVKAFNNKFKELTGLELHFEESKEEPKKE